MADPRLGRTLFVGFILAAIIHHLTQKNLKLDIWAKKPLLVEQGHLLVLVTGGAGFIGSHASLQLLEAGHSVLAVDNLSRGNQGAVEALMAIAHPERYAFAKLDLDDKPALNALLRHYKVDVVMHFAAIAYVGESVAEPLRYYHNVTSNTVTLLEVMEEVGIDKLVYSSSCATYGGVEQKDVPVTEDTPAVPNNPYGWSKWMAERAINDYAKANTNLKVAILRYFNVYGSDPQGRVGEYPRPELRHHGRISNACFDAALGEIPFLTIMGTKHPTKDGSCVRDYIHVVDLVDAHLRVISNLQNPPVLYNVGTGQPVSVKEFVAACLKVTQKSIEVKEQPHARAGDYPEMWAVPGKIYKDTGWTAKYLNVEEGLQHAWAWRLEHPNGYEE